MSYDKEFVKGMYVEKAKVDWVKATISINKAQFKEWFEDKLQDSDSKSIKIDIKESREGALYAEVNNYKKNDDVQPQHDDSELTSLRESVRGVRIDDDIPFE